MRQCMSMHLHQKNCDTMRPTNHPEQELYKKGCPFLKALQKDVLNLCPLSNQDAPNAFVEPRRTKCSNVRSGVEDTSCEGHLTHFFRRIVLARNQKNNFFYENRESTWEGHGGTIMEAEQLKTRKYVPIVSNNHIISYNINLRKISGNNYTQQRAKYTTVYINI